MGACLSLSEQDASKISAILSRENEILNLLSKQQQTQKAATAATTNQPTNEVITSPIDTSEILSRLNNLSEKINNTELEQLRAEVGALRQIVEEGFQNVSSELVKLNSMPPASSSDNSANNANGSTKDSSSSDDMISSRPSETVFFERNYVVGTIGEQNEEQAHIRIPRATMKPVDNAAEGRPSENIFFDKAYAKDELDEEKEKDTKVSVRKSDGSVRAAEIRRASMGAIKSPLQSRASVVINKGGSGGTTESTPPPPPTETVVSNKPFS